MGDGEVGGSYPSVASALLRWKVKGLKDWNRRKRKREAFEKRKEEVLKAIN